MLTTNSCSTLTSGGLARDKQQLAILAPSVKQFRLRAELHAKRGTVDAELSLYRWMLEELRISLFAQELGTNGPISPQRLEKQWAKVQP